MKLKYLPEDIFDRFLCCWLAGLREPDECHIKLQSPDLHRCNSKQTQKMVIDENTIMTIMHEDPWQKITFRLEGYCIKSSAIGRKYDSI